jgi:acetylornithine/LysW-gamma-L-lysine aminotransferase
MGAVLCSDRISSAAGRHGSTFGGNPLACAAALACIDTLIAQDLPRRAAEKGEFLVGRLRAAAPTAVREVRHLGLMVGVELKKKAQPVLKRLAAHGVLALSAGPTVVRLLPPLVITEAQLSRACDALIEALSE